MGWDSNIATTKFVGKLPLQSFNNLRAALVERCAASGTAVPAVLSADLTKMNKLPDAWFSTFQSTLTSIIIKYTNHTLAVAGSFDNQSSIPAWSVLTIVAATDAGTRLSAPSSLSAADWCYQQYQMLNLMRWTNPAYFPTSLASTRRKLASDRDWAACQSAFAAASWASYSTSTPAYGATKSPEYSISIRDGKVSYTAPTATAKHSADFYGYVDGSSGTFFTANTYQHENKWNIIETLAETDSDGADNTTVNYVYGNSYTPASPPEPADASGYQNRHFEIDVVLKFDGASGFTYKDW